MRLPLFQVDAFTNKVFAGNPAAVCPLESWLPGATLQAIAAANNLAETAFFVPAGDGFELRWFTPVSEVDLCGHATLATAFVLCSILEPARERVVFATRTAGPLAVIREGERYTLDFPARPPKPCLPPAGLFEALGGPEPRATLMARDLVVVYNSEEVVRNLKPDMTKLAALDVFAVCVTAKSDTVDFVSRFFAPRQGIPEDPVTGSAHCTLVPYWAERLDRSVLEARQVSGRGGALSCRLSGDRVFITGSAALYLEGMIDV
ncbi:MAG TPA: PhzF family phenazine biosynthesis protein [Azospirillaceae bacterium]|nr:PhzF family phenazine biosynthesis protein [Azospirillaceae bacterium]